MRKTTKAAIVVISIIGVVGISYAIYRKRKKSYVLPGSTVDGEECTSEMIFPLKKGSGKGSDSCSREYVESLQLALNVVAFAPIRRIEVDGIFGDNTESMLMVVNGKTQLSQSEYVKFINEAKSKG